MAFETFEDFLLLTREEKLDPSEVVRTVCMKQNYTYAELIRGKALKKLTQGGTAMKLFLRTALAGSYAKYAPGDNFTPVAADVLEAISVAWKFNTVNFSWFDEENLLNKYGKSSFADLLTEVYEPNMVLDFIDGVENDLWAVPNTATMEASTGDAPFSIPCFINEYTNTLPTGFSTVMGLAPATTTVWQNQRSSYSAANILNPTAATGLAAALDKAARLIKFQSVPFGPAKSAQTQDNMSDRVLLLTNGDGVDKYNALLRAMNDRTFKPADVKYKNAQFNDSDVIWIPKLDTAAIYSGAAVAASHSSGVAQDGYPRFYMVHTKDLHPILNSHMFFDRMKIQDGGVNKPNLKVQYVRSAWNLACEDRQTHAIVYPGTA
jgi:hypothetical protein